MKIGNKINWTLNSMYTKSEKCGAAGYNKLHYSIPLSWWRPHKSGEGCVNITCV